MSDGGRKGLEKENEQEKERKRDNINSNNNNGSRSILKTVKKQIKTIIMTTNCIRRMEMTPSSVAK